MEAVIRVVVTSVYEYRPDLNENEYKSKNVTTLQEALELDKSDYERGRLSLDEICYNPPVTNAEWSVINE